MKMKTIALILTLALVLAVSLPLSAGLTAGKGKMSGTVTDKETGAPIDGVTIKLYCVEVQQFHSPAAKTDAEGKWKSFYVRKGAWNLDFQKSGYETLKISYVVDTTPGSKNPPIEVQMKKMEGPAVSATVVKDIDLAKNLMAEKKYKEALEMMPKIKSENKDDPGIDIIYLYIGNCYASQGDFNKAVEYYKQSLEKFPKNAELIVSIGNAYNNLQDYEKAMEWFSKLSIDEIHNMDTLYNIGVIAYNKGDFAVAANYFKKATEVNVGFADAYYQLGMALVGLEKQEEALAALKKFMEMAPDSPNFETAKAIVEAYK